MFDLRVFQEDHTGDDTGVEGSRLVTVLVLSLAGPVSLLFYPVPLKLIAMSLGIGAVAGGLFAPRVMLLHAIGLVLLLIGSDAVLELNAPASPRQTMQSLLLSASATVGSYFTTRWLWRFLIKRRAEDTRLGG